MLNGKWNAIVQCRARGCYECLRYEGLAIVDAVQIAVLEDTGARSGQAKDIYDALRYRIDELVTSGLVPPLRCDGPQGRLCFARAEPNCRSLLIVVTGDHGIDPAVREEIQSWGRGGPGEDIVVPILPARADPGVVLGPGIDRTNALIHYGDTDSIVVSLLQRAGFGGVQRRLFISYRRSDSQPLADQLFDAFSRKGFQVFLDRFSGTPGRLFPDELSEEIIDKGVVLLLETRGLGQSPWTLAEVGFAFLFRLGLLAVNVDNALPMLLIGSDERIRVRVNATGELDRATLESVTAFVGSAYPRQMMQRRLYLENVLALGLRLQGLSPQAIGGGLFEITARGRSFYIGLAERAPSLTDVRRTEAAAVGAKAEAILLGPYRFLAPERRRDLRWLVDRLNVGLMSEGEIIRSCQDLARGVLPR